MKIKKKFLITILLVTMTGILVCTNKVDAALQSNGGTAATYNLSDWMLKIRQMQELGGTLGLSDTINTSDLTSTSTELDIHMEKNTEYGAMIILSASAYGNPNKIEDGGTTTGNSTGVVMKLNKEWVAAGADGIYATNLNNAAKRYKNTYTTSYVAKSGDAISETEGWHNSGASKWLNKESISGLLRSYSGSVFSYFGTGGAGVDYYTEDAYYNRTRSSRAAVVVGTGL